MSLRRTTATGQRVLLQLRHDPRTVAMMLVVPCVLIGSDQYYTHRNWIPFRRAQAWIAFGEPLRFEGEGKEARPAFEARIAVALRALFAELKERFFLTAADLPQPPMRRKGRV